MGISMNENNILKLFLLDTKDLATDEPDMMIRVRGKAFMNGIMPRSTMRGNVWTRESRYFFGKSIISFKHISFRLIEGPNGSSVEGIAMGQTEVTQELFEAVMGFNPSEFKDKPDSPQRPVENVTWYDCIMFCNKLSEGLGLKPYYTIDEIKKNDDSIKSAGVTEIGGKGFRLPTEAEWLAFAKAGTENEWAGTDDENEVGRVGWYKDNSNGQTHPVAQLLPNEWGLYDMSGNVDEWCWIKSKDYKRVVRGGSWVAADASFLCSAFRFSILPSYCDDYLGFRICRTIR
jgi:formylglycine-generating enzyme required for sulfatase activity